MFGILSPLFIWDSLAFECDLSNALLQCLRILGIPMGFWNDPAGVIGDGLDSSFSRAEDLFQIKNR